jgi:hypothetical protein
MAVDHPNAHGGPVREGHVQQGIDGGQTDEEQAQAASRPVADPGGLLLPRRILGGYPNTTRAPQARGSTTLAPRGGFATEMLLQGTETPDDLVRRIACLLQEQLVHLASEDRLRIRSISPTVHLAAPGRRVTSKDRNCRAEAIECRNERGPEFRSAFFGWAGS